MKRNPSPHNGNLHTHSLSDAAAQLGVDPKTLTRWLTKQDMQPIIDPADRRIRRITDAQLKRLSRIKNRALPGTSPESTWEQLAEQVRALQETVYSLQETVHTLHGAIERRGSVPRLLQVLSDGTNAPIQGNIAPPSVSTINGILDAAIALVETAPPLLFPHENELIFTFLGETDLLDLASDSLRRSWRRVLQEASRQGWRIVHLIRQTPDLERTMRIVEGLIHMLGISAGLYNPLYYTATDAMDTCSDFVVVPNHGMLELTRRGRYIDNAHPHPVGERYHALYNYVRELRDKSKPLITRYHPLSVDFSRAITHVDAHESDRYLVLNGLSDLTVPGWIHRERAHFLNSTYPNDVELARKVTGITENRRLRALNFTHVVEHHLVRDICPKAAIQGYIISGEYAPDDWFRKMGCEPLTSAQIRAHVKHLIDRLNRWDNYQLGLIDDHSQIEPFEYRAFWLVKAKHAVLLECEATTAAGTNEEIDLRISEEEVVRGFFKHAENLWRDLGRANTDKRDVIRFLEAQRDRIPPDSSQPEGDSSPYSEP